MLSNSQLAEIVEQLSKAQAYQRSAWQRVIEDGRKYAQIKVHGSYNESNGTTVSVGFNERKDLEEMFKQNLLRSVERAFAEDAQMGISFFEALGNSKESADRKI
jgi:hypothetical protein